MSVDQIANALTSIKNSESAARHTCTIKPGSKLLKEILRVMQENGFVKKVDWKETRQGEEAIVSLEGRINECRVVKPRYAVKKDEFERFEKKFLPARDIGILIVSTPKGVFSHKKAKENGVGGRLLAYVF
ncbi:MAG: 30S ribosomal protein S8 [Candidatus Diapherotrites archaeon]|uniref:30S ribosomal protein S8 n=1 Tax=Candidatus Iainarchaeum sp. TaxID=3101447 RepID=A0A8T4L861_9ARCH|nr:30S ribosomal protein S8 [Candidatus Diapherotrites archaeon]